MDAFIIKGSKSLKGEIEVRGAKNATLPILAASLLTQESSVLDNLPLIEDVKKMITLLESFGVKITWLDERKIKIDPKNLNLDNLDQKLVKKIRGSVLLIAALIHRFNKVKLAPPGGCFIGVRPIDAHIDGLRQLGVKVKMTPEYYCYDGSEMVAQEVILPEFSVTATENILMLGSVLKGTTVVKIAAVEPHIEELVGVLNQMGAEIHLVNSHVFEIKGSRKLHGFSHYLEPDYLEAGTFMILSAATKGRIIIHNVISRHLDLVMKKLQNIGVKMEIIKRADGLEDVVMHPAYTLNSFKLQTLPYPGIPTDLQAPFGVLATECNGTSLIFDPMYDGRLKYIDELVKMGANALVADPHRALITGPTVLNGVEINSLDIRAGMSLVIAALIASGTTTLKEANEIDRGYEKIEERLLKLGADIKRVNLSL